LPIALIAGTVSCPTFYHTESSDRSAEKGIKIPGEFYEEMSSHPGQRLQVPHHPAKLPVYGTGNGIAAMPEIMLQFKQRMSCYPECI
jgi:hypothetical protein